MRTMQRDDVEQGPKGRWGDCCGGSGCCGGRREHGAHRVSDAEASTRRTTLEDRQRDLEQELADVAGQLLDLSNERA
jgi:hypothetical protein